MNLEEKVKIITNNSSVEYCLQKTAEELFELGEVIMKQITKPNGADSPERLAKIIEESGDVLLNINILAQKLNITDKIGERIVHKVEQCFERVNKIKYTSKK